MNKQLFVLGNLTIDDIVLYNERELFLNQSGGNALFAAIGARVWRNSVGLIARRGNDYPEENIQQLKEVGIETHLKSVDHKDIHDWALYEPDGRRQFVNHLSSGSHYDVSIVGEEIPDDCLEGAGYHIAPMPTDIQLSIVNKLSETEASLALDPHEEYLTEPPLNDQAMNMLSDVQLFLPSREEAMRLYGEDDPPKAARAFSEAGPSIVVIKLGIEGSLIYAADEDEMHHIPIYEVDTVDPTGAGDSYCGGFLAGYLQTQDPVLAACYGTVSASFVVQHVGALNILDSDFSKAQKRLKTVRKGVREYEK